MGRAKRELEKWYCCQCKSSQWMRLEADNKELVQGGWWVCIVCGTPHKHPHLWKKPPATLRD